MAKKAVATLHEGSTDGRAYSKVIKMVKSPKTGMAESYTRRVWCVGKIQRSVSTSVQWLVPFVEIISLGQRAALNTAIPLRMVGSSLSNKRTT